MEKVLIFFVGLICCVNTFEPCANKAEFRCHESMECIDSNLLCNGHEDCTDGTDEVDCHCEPPEHYKCKGSIKCIPSSFLCDGHFDCPNDDDEHDCDAEHSHHHEVTICSENEYKCHVDDECLPIELVCNGKSDCADGGDEDDGCKNMHKYCPTSGFLCQNNRCLHNRQWVCDGVDDCGDNSDEQENCHFNCNAENDQFLCANKSKCISTDELCDGKNDCPDGSDEFNLCHSQRLQNECASKKCPDLAKCMFHPRGPICVCEAGYKLNADNSKCEDINECHTFGICSQGCFNTNGSYKCQCATGFELEKDSRTCGIKGNAHPILLFAATKRINAYNLHTQELTSIADNLDHVIGVGYNEDYVYWTDISYQVERIMRARIDGTDKMTLFTAGLGKPEDLAVDYVTGNIYFSDNDYQHIAVCSKDGYYCTAIINENIHRPRSIALYPQKGRIFYTDWGDKPMIGVAGMDGFNPHALISDNVHWPNGLALDWPNERLYWIDAKLKHIESCRLDGSDRRQVISAISKHPYGLEIFNDRLYWSDWDSKSIQSCDKFTGKNQQPLIRDNVIYDIHVYHPHMEYYVRNVCRDADCSHLCLLNMNDSYSCACPIDMKLGEDRHKCKFIEKPKQILLGIDDQFIVFEHRTFGRHENADHYFVNFRIDKMAYNTISGDIIVADNKDHAIYQIDSRKFKSYRKILENVGRISAMAYDPLANNLYFTDEDRGTIEVYSFKTQRRANIFTYTSETPIALAVTSQIGKLFVIVQSTKHAKMYIISTDGRGPHYPVSEVDLGNGPISLVPHNEMEHILWTDYERGTVSYVDFQGQLHHDYIFDAVRPVSLAVVGDDIFWTSYKSMKLSWAALFKQTTPKTMAIDQSTINRRTSMIQIVATSPKAISQHRCMSSDNGGCSHICIALSGSQRSCLCPVGMEFQDMRNTTCVDSRRTNVTCKSDEFQCANGHCILGTYRCDGANDCGDDSDELHCVTDECTNGFQRCDHGICIEKSLWCDGLNDCGDFSDELNCDDFTLAICADRTQFQCKSNRTICLAPSKRCDGRRDCPNGEDELDCHGDCDSSQFKCSNGECIRSDFVCDNAKDCKDGSDELHCGNETFAIGGKSNVGCHHNTDFTCNNGECIEWKYVCDNQQHCTDGSDEKGRCDTACQNSHCKQKCQKTPLGDLCSCDDGYELSTDRETCKDLNECESGEPCAHKCENTPGAYKCSCYPGFTLANDRISCKSIEGNLSMFYTAYDTIYHLRANLVKIKSTRGAKIIGLDMHYDKKLLYFTLEDQSTLFELNWTSPRGMNKVENVGSQPTKIAVDWITDNVYFIDAGTMIKVCHMGLERCVTLLVYTDGEHINTLAVDPLNHSMFYSVLSKTLDEPKTQIYRHHLDGTNKQKILDEPFAVSAIACDFYKERIYYAGQKTQEIWSVGYSGGSRRLVIQRNPHTSRPIQMNVHESHIYLLNGDSTAISKCSVYGRKECRKFKENGHQSSNLIIAQQSRQKSKENACAEHKCTTICAPSDVGSKCICDFGKIIKPGDYCNNVELQATFQKHDNAAGNSVKKVIGIISLIFLSVLLVMGVYVSYKRYMLQPASIFTMHFSNPHAPHAPHAPANVEMQKVNEIQIKRQGNITELNNFWQQDSLITKDTEKLLP